MNYENSNHKNIFSRMILKQELFLYIFLVPVTVIFMYNSLDFAKSSFYLFMLFVILGSITTFIVGFLVNYIYMLPITKYAKNIDGYKKGPELLRDIKKRAYKAPFIGALLVFIRWFIVASLFFTVPCIIFLNPTISDIILISVIFFCNGLICMPVFFFIAESELFRVHNISRIKSISHTSVNVKGLSTRVRIILSITLAMLYPVILLITFIVFSMLDIYSLRDSLVGFIILMISSISISILCGYLLSKSTKTSINNVNQILKQLADFNGDLRVQVPCLSSDDIGYLANNFNEFLSSLNKLISSVKSSVNQINTGISQISNSTQSLSEGVTTQASSLEEISSSLTELSSQVQNNVENINQTYSIVDLTKTNAYSGNSMIKELVELMEKVNGSAGDIKKIIKVIDDIAFQTNILALNADIEAERVGKYGRGFAVVATSVRNLAGRSGEAVKDTGEKIEEVIENITKVNNLFKETAVKFEEIYNGALESSKLTNDISETIQEQANGIEQISTSLNQIEDVVQNSSASAEENAVANEELATQTNAVAELVSYFKVNDLSGIEEHILALQEKSDNE
jgi:methyl-accepting chemotaxis protein